MMKLINRQGSVVLGLIIAVIVTALVAGGLTYSWQKKQGDDKVKEVEKVAQEAQNKASDLEKQVVNLQADVKAKLDYNFQVEIFNNNIAGQQTIDSKIVKVYEDNSQEIVMASSQEKINSVLCLLTQYTKDDFLYLKTCTPESDDAKGKLVVYDVTKGELIYLENINKIYIGWGSLVFSLDKKLAIYIPDSYAQNNMIGQAGLDQDLYLFNFSEDSSTKIVTLSGLESFNKGCGAMSEVYEVSWTSNKVIQYSVFNKAKGNCVESKSPAVIRKFELQ
ncbi:MAG: hypothetical protein WCV69_04140 [Patescibacteria group bacterium]